VHGSIEILRDFGEIFGEILSGILRQAKFPRLAALACLASAQLKSRRGVVGANLKAGPETWLAGWA
jgi:hypothetical protein